MIKPGNRQAREATEPFFILTVLSVAIFYFRTLCALLHSRSTPHTWCLLHCCHAEAYLNTSISMPCATDRSIGLPEFYVTHTSLSGRQGCKIVVVQLQTVGNAELKKTGINEVSLSRA